MVNGNLFLMFITVKTIDSKFSNKKFLSVTHKTFNTKRLTQNV